MKSSIRDEGPRSARRVYLGSLGTSLDVIITTCVLYCQQINVQIPRNAQALFGHVNNDKWKHIKDTEEGWSFYSFDIKRGHFMLQKKR